MTCPKNQAIRYECSLLVLIKGEFVKTMRGTNMQKTPKLGALVTQRLRLLHKSIHTERQYLYWIKAYIRFCNRHEPDKAAWKHLKSLAGLPWKRS